LKRGKRTWQGVAEMTRGTTNMRVRLPDICSPGGSKAHALQVWFLIEQDSSKANIGLGILQNRGGWFISEKTIVLE